jgi:methylated-DNA-[protein]-cysteine S-methyltransferase
MPVKQYCVIFNTAAGWVGLLGSDAGLKRTTLPQTSREKAMADLGVNADKVTLSQEHFESLTKRFRDYFSGRRVDFPDKLDLQGATAFQRKIWEATRQIPCGETRSYAWIARRIGNSAAARAVGQALGKNPLPVVIPCHRVIASDGRLGGFTGGLAMKKRLLALEKGAG